MSDLPFFVYGTLRPGCGNDRFWVDRATATDDGVAYVIGWKLVTNGGFPYLVRAASAQSVGCLVRPRREHYDRVRDSFDALEGVPRHYLRIEVAVMTPAGPVMAWTYTPTHPDDRLLPDVPTNPAGFYDWAERKQWNRLTHSTNPARVGTVPPATEGNQP